MIFLLRYSLGFNLLFLIKLLVYTIFITSIGFLHVNSENELLVIMPVTTRSQARLSTGSSHELSIAISTGTRVLSATRSTGIRVLSEERPPHHSINTLSDTSDFQCLPSYITPSSSNSTQLVDHCCCLSDSCSTIFQISKFETFETDVQQISNSSTQTSFVPLSSQFSIMEADCKDTTLDQKMSQDTIDLMQILTMLLH